MPMVMHIYYQDLLISCANKIAKIILIDDNN